MDYREARWQQGDKGATPQRLPEERCWGGTAQGVWWRRKAEPRSQRPRNMALQVKTVTRAAPEAPNADVRALR